MRLEFENATELSESRGLEIGFKGFKTNPADAEHLPTQIYIEFYDGKIQVHLWNGDSQDPQTILIHPDTPEAIFEANELYVKEYSLPEVAGLVRAESDVYVIEINGRELGRGATEAEAWQNAASAIDSGVISAARRELRGDMDYQFEDDEVLAAVKSSDYARQQIGGHLALMSCEQKWSLYRAIVSLAEKPAAAHHSSVKRSPEALARLVPKLRDLKSTIDAMSDSEYGDWVDALPEDEFTEFIALGEEGIAAIFRESPQ